jgi:hypothetical protein
MNMAVILIAHQGQLKPDQNASVDTIRDSSFVGQESDSLVTVTRRKDFDGEEALEIPTEKLSKLASKVYDDNFSQSLAIVGIERARRTGTYECRKIFYKSGDFLEEL